VASGVELEQLAAQAGLGWEWWVGKTGRGNDFWYHINDIRK